MGYGFWDMSSRVSCGGWGEEGGGGRGLPSVGHRPCFVAGQACGLMAVAFFPLQIPVMALVGNDAGWTQISREQVSRLGSDVACSLAYTGEGSEYFMSSWASVTLLGGPSATV